MYGCEDLLPTPWWNLFEIFLHCQSKHWTRIVSSKSEFHRPLRRDIADANLHNWYTRLPARHFSDHIWKALEVILNKSQEERVCGLVKIPWKKYEIDTSSSWASTVFSIEKKPVTAHSLKTTMMSRSYLMILNAPKCRALQKTCTVGWLFCEHAFSESAQSW